MSIIGMIINSFLLMKYPFLKIEVPGGQLTTDQTWYDRIPIGWRWAFGKQFRKELKAALLADGIYKEFRFTNIKIIYGIMCIYTNMLGPNTEEVIRHYEKLSMCYCPHCGKEARYLTPDTHEYYCSECMKARYKGANGAELDNKTLAKYRLTNKDIPVYTVTLESGSEIAVPSGVDYEKLWGLKND